MSMLDFYKGAEELELTGEDGSTIVDQVEEVVRTEVAEVAAVIEEQSAAIETLVDEVHELDDTVEELEETVDGLEGLLASGNYNAAAFAHLYNRGVKLANRLGADISGDRMGAESISDAATAEMMVRSGLEGFMDKVKEYGGKAIEFVKHIFNTVINFFVSIFSQADGLQRRAETLKKRLDGAGKLKEEISLGGWNVYFDYAKNGLGGSDKAKGWSGTQEALAGLVELGKNVSGVTLEAFKSKYSALVNALKSDATAVGKGQAKKNGSNNVIIGVSNGVRVRASYNDTDPKDLAEAAAAARSIKLNFGKDPDSKKMTSGKVKAKLDKSALGGHISDALKGVAWLRADKVAKSFSAAERDRVIGTLKSVSAGDKEKKGEVDKQINLVRAIYSAGASLTQVTAKAAASTIRAQLDGVQAHI